MWFDTIFKYYRPNNSVLTVTGVDSDFMQKLVFWLAKCWGSNITELKVKTIDKPQMSFFSQKD